MSTTVLKIIIEHKRAIKQIGELAGRWNQQTSKQSSVNRRTKVTTRRSYREDQQAISGTVNCPMRANQKLEMNDGMGKNSVCKMYKRGVL